MSALPEVNPSLDRDPAEVRWETSSSNRHRLRKSGVPADRQASAAKAVQELGINYPVLLSGRDGSCPLQQALQVQFYPTIVLVSRDGTLLAREHGATDITLPRMDRAIASALRGQGQPAMN